ncbi:MAG: ethylbenzene dehydrogenase-related protein [Chloroflexota bacterium]
MKRFKLILLLCSFLLSLGLTFLKVPLASSQGTTIVAAYITEPLPVQEPDSAAWQKATSIEVPLSAQTVTAPMIRETKIKSVTVRALHNGQQLALLVEWADDTTNAQAIRIQDFPDAVAVQFPLAGGQPFFCMGMQGTNVNIWHWKADWQADLLAWHDMQDVYPNMSVDVYPFAQGEHPNPQDYQETTYLSGAAAENPFSLPRLSPVEDLVAGGFGSLTSQPPTGQNVQGFGVYSAGKWRVIFSRDLTSSETDDVNFVINNVYSVAFAAWDGANGERNGQKSTSQWVSLQFETAPATAQLQPAEEEGKYLIRGLTAQTIFLMYLSLLFVLIVIAVIIYFRLPKEG